VLNSGAPTEQAVPVPLMAAVLLHEREKMTVIVTLYDVQYILVFARYMFIALFQQFHKISKFSKNFKTYY
jgi:hypothetical protein